MLLTAEKHGGYHLICTYVDAVKTWVYIKLESKSSTVHI